MRQDDVFCDDVVAVVVTYNPQKEVLLPALSSLAWQAGTIVIVDNASSESPHPWLVEASREYRASTEFIMLSENLGLGAAYNLGIERAQRLNAAFVLLLDQDSELEPSALTRLRATCTALISQGLSIAAVGARYRDGDAGRLSDFVRVDGWGFSRLGCGDNAPWVEADFIISSGSLLPMTAVQAVGGMDEGLFIDHVDTEWCFRARQMGYRIFGVCDAIMKHSLGDRNMRVWPIRWRTFPCHAPYRYYYVVRNAMLLRRRAYMPSAWKRADLVRTLQIVVFFGVLARNRCENLRMMVHGLLDGIRAKQGRLDYPGNHNGELH